MSEQLAIGTKVVTRLEFPGIEKNGIVYGWLPRLARGNVVAHTQDGRAVIDFPGYGAHTWHDPALLDVIEVVPDELSRLRAESEYHRGAIDTLSRLLQQSEEGCKVMQRELAAAHARIRELEAGQWKPDWSKAPDWAQWWAMDADGCSYWYSKEPETKQFVWSQGSGYGEPAGRYIIPEWRETKRRRPQLAQGEVQP